jgi:mono/diheme cytochrome c family protein
MAVTAFVATAAFAMMPASTANLPVAAETGESAASAALYRAHCARCHGNDGHANTKDGRRTEADDLTDGSVKAMAADKMTRIIKNGKGEMPANKRLSAAQITSIIRYVRGL